MCVSLRLFRFTHTIAAQKILRNVAGFDVTFNCPIKGYEIHAGCSGAAFI